jgi:hypothetical protein
MAIGVFIAPILLYWEALSSDSADKATFSANQSPPNSVDAEIPAVVPIGRLDEERILLYLQKLVAIRRAGWDSTKIVAEIQIEKRSVPDPPSPRESGNDLVVIPDLAGEGTIGVERIVTALVRVDVSPMADELAAGILCHARAGGEGQKQEKGEDGFHLQTRAGRLTRGRDKRNPA